MKNETRQKIREKMDRNRALNAAGLEDEAVNKIQEVTDIILFEISDCVNPVPSIASDITVGVLRFIAETLENDFDDSKRKNAQIIQAALRVKYDALILSTREEGDR